MLSPVNLRKSRCDFPSPRGAEHEKSALSPNLCAHPFCRHPVVHSLRRRSRRPGAVGGPADGSGPYKVLDHWKLADAGGWDYLLVDSPAHRVYITRGDHVDVVDTNDGKLIGTIGGLHGTHGVALNPDGKLGYISDGGGNAVVVFDRSSLSTVATIPAGTNPDAIIFEPTTKSVWAFNGRSNDITVIDAASQKVVATIPVPGKPEFAVADGKGNVYNNIEDKSLVLKIDASAHKITATWPAGCESPSGLAIDIEGNRLFPVCDGNKMSVIDAATGKILATPANRRRTRRRRLERQAQTRLCLQR